MDGVEICNYYKKLFELTHNFYALFYGWITVHSSEK